MPFFVYILFCFFILEAVCARFKIDRNRFDDFFRICLRRTLSQMLCDTRRNRIQTLRNDDANVDQVYHLCYHQMGIMHQHIQLLLVFYVHLKG